MSTKLENKINFLHQGYKTQICFSFGYSKFLARIQRDGNFPLTYFCLSDKNDILKKTTQAHAI